MSPENTIALAAALVLIGLAIFTDRVALESRIRALETTVARLSNDANHRKATP